MNKTIASHVNTALLAAVLAALFCLTGISAVSAADSLVPSLASPATQEDASLLNRRLQAAKRDLEQFLTFAEYFNANGDAKTAGQLHAPLDDFLKRHVDNLLLQGTEQMNLETVRLSAEVMFIKTRLFLALNQGQAAGGTLAEMKKRFGPYQKNTVQVSGKSTTLGEALRQLDEELAKSAATKKK